MRAHGDFFRLRDFAILRVFVNVCLMGRHPLDSVSHVKLSLSLGGQSSLHTPFSEDVALLAGGDARPKRGLRALFMRRGDVHGALLVQKKSARKGRPWC